MVFSDESTIQVFNDRVQTLRRRAGEEFKPECLKKTVKFPTNIVAWQAILMQDTSCLDIVNGIMNEDKYSTSRY